MKKTRFNVWLTLSIGASVFAQDIGDPGRDEAPPPSPNITQVSSDASGGIANILLAAGGTPQKTNKNLYLSNKGDPNDPQITAEWVLAFNVSCKWTKDFERAPAIYGCTFTNADEKKTRPITGSEAKTLWDQLTIAYAADLRESSRIPPALTAKVVNCHKNQLKNWRCSIQKRP